MSPGNDKLNACLNLINSKGQCKWFLQFFLFQHYGSSAVTLTRTKFFLLSLGSIVTTQQAQQFGLACMALQISTQRLLAYDELKDFTKSYTLAKTNRASKNVIFRRLLLSESCRGLTRTQLTWPLIFSPLVVQDTICPHLPLLPSMSPQDGRSP